MLRKLARLRRRSNWLPPRADVPLSAPTPLVSVVIPAYNAERFIERTLRSALAQTYPNLEIIIIDDGSTDGTPAIAKSATTVDRRVRCIRTVNGGVAFARNRGISESTGRFIAFLDADDLWHPAKIELQVASLMSGTAMDAAAAYALHRVIDPDDRIVGESAAFVCSGYTFARLLYAKFVGNGSSLLVRREAAIAVGGFDSAWAARGLGGCEDLDFELKIAAKHRFVAVQQYLVGYRVSPGNMSSDKVRMAKAIVATVDHHIDLHPELPRWAARMARAATHEYALGLLLTERRRRAAWTALVQVCGNDANRGLAVAASLAARKLAKLGKASAIVTERAAEAPLFDEVAANMQESAADTPRASLARDIAYMQKLARIDAALAATNGSVKRVQTERCARAAHPSPGGF